MAAKKPPKLSAGQVLIAAVVAQMAEDGLEPDARDTSLLATSGRLADRMAALDVLIEADGERSTSETGIVRLHPGIAEYRQHDRTLQGADGGRAGRDQRRQEGP